MSQTLHHDAIVADTHNDLLMLHPGTPELQMAGLDAKAVIPGLEGPAGLPLVTQELVRRGWDEADIRKVLGGNVLRLFRAELGRPTATGA